MAEAIAAPPRMPAAIPTPTAAPVLQFQHRTSVVGAVAGAASAAAPVPRDAEKAGAVPAAHNTASTPAAATLRPSLDIEDLINEWPIRTRGGVGT